MTHAARKCMDSVILIYDENRELITKTVVTGYGKDEMYIEVSEGLEGVRPGTRFHLLVIHPDSVSEFSGKLQSIRQGIYEISIHGQRQREARSATRYPVKTRAQIKELVVDKETVTLIDPISISIVNISSSGVLIISPNIMLVEGIFLTIEFILSERSYILHCRVVREPDNDSDPDSFGCQIVFKN